MEFNGMNAITRIDNNFSTSPQIHMDNLADIKAAGFNSVICNRPDSEDRAVHPGHHVLESGANELGLRFAYLPVVPGQISESDVARFKALLDELPAPVLGYCRTGTRSRTLYERAR
jgi:uncharacterized protein (TIGR01244 family)